MRLYSGSIQLVAVGKLKTPYWNAAQAEYMKRISRYISLELKEVKDGPGEDKALLSVSDVARTRIALVPEGKSLDSPGLALFIQKQIDTYQRLSFLIGGPEGLSREVVGQSQTRLSLSAMTFPHELARVIFLEQLYRAFTILGGEKYHK